MRKSNRLYDFHFFFNKIIVVLSYPSCHYTVKRTYYALFELPDKVVLENERYHSGIDLFLFSRSRSG